eukprot:CAMPEP_0194056562 /NCGR_PEP_ID=MMETSP0009_2-20130614/60551_1 /TAXON_ID=210454 /ORGANISM="Grammatophora oceanica, Strain CCMP 410" /LENGTH=33 /DNA_ID= /DNA_START= /DNA_END= /DNA_ORIENTATION=
MPLACSVLASKKDSDWIGPKARSAACCLAGADP